MTGSEISRSFGALVGAWLAEIQVLSYALETRIRVEERTDKPSCRLCKHRVASRHVIMDIM
jgi:hypothetical protein